MHLLHLTPVFIDTQMTVKDFHLACEWIDEYAKAAREG
jgi:hypothetical protein